MQSEAHEAGTLPRRIEFAVAWSSWGSLPQLSVEEGAFVQFQRAALLYLVACCICFYYLCAEAQQLQAGVHLDSRCCT